MTALISDPILERRLIAERRAKGADRFDEVWNGVYVMSPLANNEHQQLSGRLFMVLFEAIEEAGLGNVYPGANVSDRRTKWKHNYRCPDLLVFLNENPAEDRKTHWVGGPDLAVEIVSPRDRSYKKLGFYAKVNTREVLIIDRDPWELVLFRCQNGTMVETGRSTLRKPAELISEVVPLRFKLTAVKKKPQIEITHTDGKQRWTVKSA
jgi:Uma2 family endonuclease